MQHPAQEAARLLWNCRVSGTAIEALPEALRPRDAAAGHAVQAELPGVAGQRVVAAGASRELMCSGAHLVTNHSAQRLPCSVHALPSAGRYPPSLKSGLQLAQAVPASRAHHGVRHGVLKLAWRHVAIVA